MKKEITTFENLFEVETPTLPKGPISKEKVLTLASQGIPAKTIAQLFGISYQELLSKYKEEFNKGRAEIAAKNRIALVTNAFAGNSSVQIYLDKLLSGEQEVINLNVTRPLKHLSEEELLGALDDDNERC